MPTLLVTATELANHPEWVIVDCRHDLKDPDTGTRGYAQGHIPRAQFVHLDRDLSAAKTGLNVPELIVSADKSLLELPARVTVIV